MQYQILNRFFLLFARKRYMSEGVAVMGCVHCVIVKKLLNITSFIAILYSNYQVNG